MLKPPREEGRWIQKPESWWKKGPKIGVLVKCGKVLLGRGSTTQKQTERFETDILSGKVKVHLRWPWIVHHRLANFPNLKFWEGGEAPGTPSAPGFHARISKYVDGRWAFFSLRGNPLLSEGVSRRRANRYQLSGLVGKQSRRQLYLKFYKW
jgi:hypothetical protein